MPQYELDPAASSSQSADGASRLIRGRSPEDAVRRALSLDAGAEIEIGDAALGTGWCGVHVDGALAARLRARDRMRFRRD